MKKRYITLIVLILMLAQACTPATATPISTVSDPALEPVSQTEVSSPPTEDAPQPIVITSLPADSSGGVEPATSTLDPNAFFTGDVTLANQEQTINLHTGDSFLLNLGTDQYDWTVSVDNESVLHIKMGVMVIKGAQGIYDALAPGKATLTVEGDPLCRQSTPAYAMPSILFTVYVVVK